MEVFFQIVRQQCETIFSVQFFSDKVNMNLLNNLIHTTCNNYKHFFFLRAVVKTRVEISVFLADKCSIAFTTKSLTGNIEELGFKILL